MLEIEIPQMECVGDAVGPHVIEIATDANYGFVFKFELTAALVAYLYKAFSASPPSYFNSILWCERSGGVTH